MSESVFEVPAFEIDDNHRLVSNEATITNVDNPKNTLEFRPEAIIIHYTAGASAVSSARSLADPEVKASAHVVVGREKDDIFQITPFNVVAWHAGKSEYTFADGQLRKGFNGFSIGIEIDNPGELTPSLGGYRTWFGRVIDEADVIKAVHRNQSSPRFWHAYTQKQIAMVQEICRILIARYPIKHILGHEEISPQRKTDPGPAFPLDFMRNVLLGANRRDETEFEMYPTAGKVTASRLNIRADASKHSPRVAVPLESGAPVHALREQNGWYYVSATVEGWVDGRHVELEVD